MEFEGEGAGREVHAFGVFHEHMCKVLGSWLRIQRILGTRVQITRFMVANSLYFANTCQPASPAIQPASQPASQPAPFSLASTSQRDQVQARQPAPASASQRKPAPARQPQPDGN
jgi:hypothetical protein